jgi:hypothetical protein
MYAWLKSAAPIDSAKSTTESPIMPDRDPMNQPDIPVQPGSRSETPRGIGRQILPGELSSSVIESLSRASNKYQIIPQLPLSSREMVRIWRGLRRMGRIGPPEDLDVEGTIDDICRTGVFVRPVLRSRRRNQLRLLLLIDRHNYMDAFAPLVEALVASVYSSGLLRNTYIFYFREYPDEVLYEDINVTHPRPTASVLETSTYGSSVLFISDAGAAKGLYESHRVKQTNYCLEQLRNYTYRIAWLNLLPRERWSGTSAGKIAQNVPMFPVSRDGLIDAVNILRGHPSDGGGE